MSSRLISKLRYDLYAKRQGLDPQRPVGGFRLVEAPQIQPGDDLQPLQQIAILHMMYSTTARGLAQRIASTNDIQDRPVWSDFHALTEKGLCIRPVGSQWHVLTLDGQDFAKRMLSHLCRTYNVHVMDEIRGDDGSVRFRCSCGKWSSGVFRSSGMYTWRRASNSFSAHLPKVDANGNPVRKNQRA